MRTEIKFCGLTRSEDVQAAVRLGCSYVGVIFAGGPREISADQASRILEGVPAQVRRVGVFANQDPARISEVASQLELGVVQLHGDVTIERIRALGRYYKGTVWPVVRVAGAALPKALDALYGVAGIVLLDAHVPGTLGGTGVALAWDELATPLRIVRQGRPLVLAGGLRPENVGQAIASLEPTVVDVSSGVELAPGVKDHARMRAFRDAVISAGEMEQRT